jgi:hypothetical protein
VQFPVKIFSQSCGGPERHIGDPGHGGMRMANQISLRSAAVDRQRSYYFHLVHVQSIAGTLHEADY